MNNLRGSRKEAKIFGDKYYFTGKECVNGHLSPKATSSGACCECMRLANLNHYYSNKEYRNSKNREWRNCNLKHRKIYEKNYKITNKHKVNFWNNNRRAFKINATPLWLTNDQENDIKLQYYISKEYELLTGLKYHVDHIVPLKHKNVCGLHVPWNLRVVRSEINLKKYNSFDGGW